MNEIHHEPEDGDCEPRDREHDHDTPQAELRSLVALVVDVHTTNVASHSLGGYGRTERTL